MVTGTENSNVLPADRLLEDEEIGLRVTGRQPEGMGPVAEQREHGISLGCGEYRTARRRLERDAANQDGEEGLRLHGEPGRGERQVDAARLPEPRVRGDVLVVGGVHEHLHRERLAIRVERVRRDLADLQAAEVDRGAVVERPQVRRLQREVAAGDVPRHHRRVLERHEVALLLLRAADLHAEIGP
jgi:hypothetical protein